MNIIKSTSLAIILLSSSSSTIAEIYKCNISGEISYQSVACDTPEASKTLSLISKIPPKTKAVKSCENAFNKCLTTVSPTLYKQGKDYCSAHLDLCVAKSKKRSPETIQRHVDKISFLAKVYNDKASSIATQKRSKELQAEKDALDAKYNARVRSKANKSYKACFNRRSSSIHNAHKPSNILKRTCANDMPTSCSVGLRKFAKRQCNAERANYLKKWLK